MDSFLKNLTRHSKKVRSLALLGAPKSNQSKPRSPRRKSYNEQIVLAWFKEIGIPPCLFEHRFHDSRLWRFDIAWPEYKVALEVQGGIHTRGRHTRGAALKKEWEKINTAASMGWRMLYCEPSELCFMETAKVIKAALSWNVITS